MEPVHVEAGVVVRAFQGSYQGFRAGLARGTGEGGNGGIHNIGARFNGLQVGHVSQGGGKVGMDIDGHADFCLQCLHQLIGAVRA